MIIKMIERDIAHLRFLHNISVKGSALCSEDIDFVIRKKSEIEQISQGIDEILEFQKIKEENR